MKSEFKDYKHFILERSAEETAGFYYFKPRNLEDRQLNGSVHLMYSHDDRSSDHSTT